ncbi:TIGR03086 family metal-binding protein [Phaeacidiphilus oryzae]|uniref:TIGR03086 family metal-binding protein n=1 Tax=Phaeacidiphilus oryzae TaxID=348818 RepID=UPI00068D22ED|nr:TIGR03086 family metal-binding protein [Phaeacidiphilus oryzae]
MSANPAQAGTQSGSDPRELLRRALDQAEALLRHSSPLTPELLGAPTPCTEYDLRTLLGHLVGAAHRIAYAGEGGRMGDVAAAVGQVADDDWPGAVRRARTRCVAAWADDARLERMIEAPWGTAPGRAVLSVYVQEIATHTWDAARVLDPKGEFALDPELAEFALATAQQVLPADRRGEGVPFDAVQPVPEGADAYARLAGWLGRRVIG